MQELTLYDIFPAIDHLKQYLMEIDIGAIALSSKTLYNLILLNFKQFQTDISIIKHYIHNPHYYKSINIDFIVHEQKLSVPIPKFIIALKKLRILIGQEEFFKSYNYIFFKKDLIYNKKHFIIQDFCVCPFCEKFIESGKHADCWGVDREIELNTRRENMKNYVCPELEYYVMHNEQVMPKKMEYKCHGKFINVNVFTMSDSVTKTSKCIKCSLPYIFHQIPYKK